MYEQQQQKQQIKMNEQTNELQQYSKPRTITQDEVFDRRMAFKNATPKINTKSLLISFFFVGNFLRHFVFGKKTFFKELVFFKREILREARMSWKRISNRQKTSKIIFFSIKQKIYIKRK